MKAIYVRVSTEDQAKNGYSISDQIRQCKQKAGTSEVLEYIDDGVSGGVINRPALNKLRDDIRLGLISEVICYDADRLSRNLVNQLLITEDIEKRAKLTFVIGEYSKDADGNLHFHIRGAFSEFEKAKITERMSRGRREKAKQGKVVKDYQVYGYTFDREKNMLKINESEANVVNLMFKLFTDKETQVKGINGIANYLTQQNIPTKRGAKVWHRQVVRQILMNRVYIGEFYQNRWNTEGMLANKFKEKDERVPLRERPKDEWILVTCPAIIETNQFIYAQKLLEESRRRWAGTSKNNYLLSGLVRCGDCGNTMPGRQAKNWGKYVFEYFDRKNTAGAKNKGCGKKIKVDELDNIVWNNVFNWLSQPDNILSEDDTEENLDSFEMSEVERIEKILIDKKEGKKRLLSLIINSQADGIDDEDIKDILSKTSDEIEKLNIQLNEIKQRLEVKDDDLLRENLLQQATNYYLNLNPNEITFEDKQELIRFLVREVRVSENGIKIFTF
jgi:site-specific DNA recombinase